jgi:UDP-N-acetylglucosamine 2-epimerase (non-hydrolysing)
LFGYKIRVKILVALGTRPEAVKLAPVIMALRARGIATDILFSGQHQELALPVLGIFGLAPEYRFSVPLKNFSLQHIAASYLEQAGEVIATVKPDLVLVQGDTTTAFAVALAAYYQSCPVGHVEAGLRTYNPYSPYPEENHRRMIAVLASLHFAPSELAREALLAECIAEESIAMTGNTVIDALQWILQNIPASPETPRKPYILVTAHRRENFAELHQQYFASLNALATSRPDLQVLFVRHPNPNVKALAAQELTAPNIRMIEPQSYEKFVYLMRDAKLIITDSGGIQEESAFLGKPTLVIREQTERKELLDKGNVVIVGTDSNRLQEEVARLLSDSGYYKELSRVNLAYGTGNASSLIVDSILQWKRSAKA